MSPLSGVPLPRLWRVGATVLVLLALVGFAVIAAGHKPPASVGHSAGKGSPPAVAAALSRSGPGSLASDQQSDLQQNITRIRALVPVNSATSPQYPAVSAQARQQPDLYAAAFVSELFTQDYRTSRDQLLAWVQSESAQSTDPLVVSLTPGDLRSRIAVASVQDGVNGPAPVPSRSDWADLARRQGHTTVQIQGVTEPVAWASAVANAQITDPGVTARQVDAEVTLQTTDQGKATSEDFSVALVVNLEGPPVRDGYGFVAVINDNVAGVG
jgi:hypothetical protein